MKKFCLRIGLLAAVATVALSATSGAAEMVVTNVSGAPYPLGAILKSGEHVNLPVGTSLTLLGSDGSVLHLDGPHNGPLPAKSGGAKNGSSVLATLSKVLTQRSTSSSSLGAVRSVGSAAVPAPEPWLVSVEGSGHRCIRKDEAPVLWRSNNSRSQQLSLTGGNRVYRAIPWAAGQDRIKAPANIFRDGGAYRVVLDTAVADLTIHVAPANIATSGNSNPAEQAAWMYERGCFDQSVTLLQSLR